MGFPVFTTGFKPVDSKGRSEVVDYRCPIQCGGINIYPEKFGSNDFVEFDSMINLRPSQKNRSRGVEDKKIQGTIIEIVNSKIDTESSSG